MGSRSASVSRWWEHRRALWAVSPGELVALQKQGTVSESLKACAALAQEEALGLVNALGGVEHVSEQRMVLIQDTVRLGLVLRAVMVRFLQGDGDPELASKVGTLASARRASLQALGLERVAKEVDLPAYLERRASEEPTEATNGAAPDPSIEDAVGVSGEAAAREDSAPC